MLLINLSNQTEFRLSIHNILNTNLVTPKVTKVSFFHKLKSTFSWIGSKSTDAKLTREEYRLTPQGGDIKSKTMLLNGIPLMVTKTGEIPQMKPAFVNVNSPVSIAPLNIKFIQFPNFQASGCK